MTQTSEPILPLPSGPESFLLGSSSSNLQAEQQKWHERFVVITKEIDLDPDAGWNSYKKWLALGKKAHVDNIVFQSWVEQWIGRSKVRKELEKLLVGLEDEPPPRTEYRRVGVFEMRGEED